MSAHPDPTGPLFDVGYHGTVTGIREAATAVESAGGRGLFVSEASHDPYIPLATAAEHTSAITLGTSVAIAFARTPMSTAYTVHDLHRLSGGRVVLGLGTQIAPHIVKRFSMPWSRPASRMREYVAALRTIWESWETGTPLSFEGDFYTHTLMPDLFSPGPLGMPPPPIWVAAVGERMVAAAAAVADGVIWHPMTSADYRDSVLLPALTQTRERLGRTGEFTTSIMAMVATGNDERELASAVASIRRQIAFYASTPAYLPVLAHHGWEELHREAHAGMRRGDYTRLGDLVDDTVLHTFAVVGEAPEVARQLRDRYANVDRVTLTLPGHGLTADNALFRVLEHTA